MEVSLIIWKVIHNFKFWINSTWIFFKNNTVAGKKEKGEEWSYCGKLTNAHARGDWVTHHHPTRNLFFFFVCFLRYTPPPVVFDWKTIFSFFWKKNKKKLDSIFCANFGHVTVGRAETTWFVHRVTRIWLFRYIVAWTQKNETLYYHATDDECICFVWWKTKIQ